MKTHLFKPFSWMLMLFIIISLACSSTPAASPTAQPATTEEPDTIPSQPETLPTPTQAEPLPEATSLPSIPAGLVTSLEDVAHAVIQIEAEGTFVDPEVGWMVNVGSRGTGFIISSDGLAVTNNHVVTGAALLRVWVSGESRPRNARILGVSECSDLAVIDIQGDDFRYLDWYDGDIKVGLDVYAAGFPLGDPEYTLTRGIVSKARADGETSWASVDWVIEHSAKINPGNSGGPLVDSEGRLIGVNYAVVSSTDQNFAISREVAAPIIRELQGGKDMDSIGVNGAAVHGEVSGIPISGVWVRSVSAGSPADQARIQAGDIIYQLQGQVLSTDGTMSDYCDILRTRRPTDTMDLTIIRYNDLSLMEGQLNGRELAVSGFFTGSSADSNSGGWVNDGCFLNDSGSLTCFDDTDTIMVDVPSDWIEYDGGKWVFENEVIGVTITAAPNLDYYNSYYDSPGVFFGASDTFARYGGYIQFLDIIRDEYKSVCRFGSREDYKDIYYEGKLDYYFNCGGAGGSDTYVVSAVSSADRNAYIILIIIQVPKGEVDAVNLILDSFLVGEL
jgi:serine protease Do